MREKPIGKTPVKSARKTNIDKIVRYLEKRIIKMGYHVFIKQSHHSNSQYLKVYTGLQTYSVRVSDHRFHARWGHDWDIYAGQPRKDAISHLAFMELFNERVKTDAEKSSVKLAKTSINGET